MSSRRRRVVSAVLVALLASLAISGATQRATAAGDPEPRTPIRHFITVMQQNHSFDNYFGTYPGADGIPPATCMPLDPVLAGGKCIKPFHLGNRAVEDLNHSAVVARAQTNGGRMNGFVAAIARERGAVEPQVMGYYDARDLPYYWNVADEYVLFDRFFTSALSGSVANQMYWVTGGPGNTRGDFIPDGGFDVPTIFDRLERKGISWKFYVEHYDDGLTFRSRALGDRGSQLAWVPLLNFPRYVDDPGLFAHIVPIDDFYEDVRRGTLPAVSYVVPARRSSEHPPGSIKAGETFVRSLVSSIMRSAYWTSSALMWTYDDWGGWYDHVRPPRVDRFGYGVRAPALLVSAYARRGHIEHATMDSTSMLKFIETNWGLEPLARRDREATSIARVFDFSRGPREAVYLGRERRGTAPPTRARTDVYVTYAAALGLTLLVVLVAIAWDRIARRRSGITLSVLAAALFLAAWTPSSVRAASPVRPVAVQTVPPVEGIRIVQGGRWYTTDRRGQVTIRAVDRRRGPEGFGFATPRVRPKAIRPGVIARFSRFYPNRTRTRLDVALSIFYRVWPRFVDAHGLAVESTRVRRFVYRNSLGTRTAGSGAQQLELRGTRVSRRGRHGELRSSSIGYSVESVDIDGSNVVNAGQVRFHPSRTREVRIKLLLFDVTIAGRDALFGTPRGSAVEVRYPDGHTTRHRLDNDGAVRLRRLARGSYRIQVKAAGVGTTQPLSLSRDQQIEVRVVSAVDLALGGALLAGIAGALFLAGRPALRLRLRRRLSERLPIGCLLALAVSGLLAAPATGAIDASRPVGLWAYYYIWFNASSWNRAKLDAPLLGRYSSDEPSVMRQHIRLAKAAGIDGFIVSWKSTPTLDRRLRELVRVAEQERFRLAVIYQGLDFNRRPLPVQRVTFDLARFQRDFARSPVFRAFGRPLVIWSGTWKFSPRELASVAAEHRDALRLLASERNPSDYIAKAAPFEGNAYYWSSVNPATFPRYERKLQVMGRLVHQRGGLWIAPAAPGFDARLIGRRIVVKRKHGETLRRQLDAAQQSDPDAIGLISWNEFSENTHIEPSRNFGTRALEVIADVEGTEFAASGDLDSSASRQGGHGIWPLVPLVGFMVAGLVLLVVVGRRRRTDRVASTSRERHPL